MSFEPAPLFALGVGYLALLFGIAWITDRGLIPRHLVRHPLVYTLSLGVFASVWATYSTIGNAYRFGYGYLAHYLGIALAFLLSPLMLRPILEIAKTYQLSSLADLLAFRYRSPWCGTLTTLLLLFGATPLLALQIQAVADTGALLAPAMSQDLLAFTFCLLITLFTILFGTTGHTGRPGHDGLVMAIAFESLVKLAALLVVGGFAVHGAFGGFGGLQSWLEAHPALLENLRETQYLSEFHITILLFFAAAVATPHMFYMTFSENPGPGALTTASWAMPGYFLLLSLPVLPILWAGLNGAIDVPVEYFTVAIGAHYGADWVTLLGFIGGLSAASGLIIVVTLALSNMCLNHLVLRLHKPTTEGDLYRWLAWNRRGLTLFLIWLAFLFHYLLDDRTSVQAIGNAAFTASLQFLPAITALLYWPAGNKKGFIAGLGTGTGIWLAALMVPILQHPAMVESTTINWSQLTALSLLANTVVFILVSLYTDTSDEERSAADFCALNAIRRRSRSGLLAKSPDEFVARLSKPLGPRTAQREVDQAMRELRLSVDERRPAALRMLRGRLEANLSGLLGPSIAHRIIDDYLPYSVTSNHGAVSVGVLENRLDSRPRTLSGLAADLDNLRRYHRRVLMDLPLGVCSLGIDREVVMWNLAMERITGVAANEVLGLQLSEIEEPWRGLLDQFLNADTNHQYKQHFVLNGKKRSINLHKAVLDTRGDRTRLESGAILLVEDMSERELLEAGLTHSERLASIGRLAAGVAHEIGNPITGIACLAQNIRDEFPDPDLRAMANSIIEQTARTSRIVQSLMNFAHAGSSATVQEAVPVPVRDCMQEAIHLVSLDKTARPVTFEVEGDAEIRVLGDPQRLLQVLLNLINNARDASQPGSVIQLSTRRTEDRVRIDVIDAGIGIPAAILDRIFDPFFTTKEAGEGTGLGLSLVYSIIENMQGTIDIVSPADPVLGVGTRVTLLFPDLFRQADNHNKNTQDTNDEGIDTTRGDIR